jgi:RimJ/RimL family protein N-acetyltransferase
VDEAGDLRIETPRLVLRRWLPADVDPLAEIHADPAIMGWLGPLTLDDAALTVERYEHLGGAHVLLFAVDDPSIGQLVGRVGVMRAIDRLAG